MNDASFWGEERKERSRSMRRRKEKKERRLSSPFLFFVSSLSSPLSSAFSTPLFLSHPQKGDRSFLIAPSQMPGFAMSHSQKSHFV